MRLGDWLLVALILILAFGGGGGLVGYEPGPKHLTIVEETADRSPAWGALYVELQTKLPEHQVSILDADDTLAPDVSGHTLPALIITDKSGATIYEGECPKTRAEIEELLP